MAYSINPFLHTTDSHSIRFLFVCQALLQHFSKKYNFLHFIVDRCVKQWYNKLSLGDAIVPII